MLAATSNFFDTIFRDNDYVDRKKSNVDLQNIITSSTLKEVLNFIYTGHVEVTVANVDDLLKASELFEISGIMVMCIDFVESALSRLWLFQSKFAEHKERIKLLRM